MQSARKNPRKRLPSRIMRGWNFWGTPFWSCWRGSIFSSRFPSGAKGQLSKSRARLVNAQLSARCGAPRKAWRAFAAGARRREDRRPGKADASRGRLRSGSRRGLPGRRAWSYAGDAQAAAFRTSARRARRANRGLGPQVRAPGIFARARKAALPNTGCPAKAGRITRKYSRWRFGSTANGWPAAKAAPKKKPSSGRRRARWNCWNESDMRVGWKG